ncbi:MAG: RnfABCDGE type electron transport complex subunit C [Erysipelotrichaceae bacterium]
MDFLIGPMKKHLNGHKELTAHNEVVSYLSAPKLYIPLMHGPAKIEVLVNEGDYVKVGTLLAHRNDHFYVPMFASCSGVVKGVEKRMHSSLRMVEHLVIENDQKYTVEDNLSVLDYQKASEEEIAAFIKEKGIVGQGGAGFPTYIKYQNVKGCERLIINAVECEPYITADYAGLELYMDDFKDGVQALFKASKAPLCQIAIKSTKPEMIEKLKEAFKDVKGVEISAVPDAYPMGWERTLIYTLTKKRYDRLPIEVGCIVSNETTAIALGKAMRTGVPVVEKMITVSGDGIAKPSNVICSVGTVAKEILEFLGGTTAEEIQLIAGGPMMGSAMTSDQIVIGSANNALTVLKYQEVDPIGCLRCGTCVDHCPSGLQPVNINNAEKAKNLDRIVDLKADQCIECGMCTFVCPSKIAVTEGVRRAKRVLALKKK